MIECKNNHVMIPELEKPNYQAAEASRLVGLRSDRVRRWLKGYDYQYDAETRHQKPVISRNEYQETRYASFLDLIDLLFVKRLFFILVNSDIDAFSHFPGGHLHNSGRFFRHSCTGRQVS